MNNTTKLAFDRINYIIMIVGVLTLILGFYLMTFTTKEFGQGTLEMTVGPIVVMAGFLIEIVAILYKGKAKKEINE